MHGWPIVDDKLLLCTLLGSPKKLHGSSSQRGQHSPGCKGNGLSHVRGGHSNFQQLCSPNWKTRSNANDEQVSCVKRIKATTYQTFTRLTTVYPLLTTLELNVPQFLMRTRLLWPTLWTTIDATGVVMFPIGTIARLILA